MHKLGEAGNNPTIEALPDAEAMCRILVRIKSNWKKWKPLNCFNTKMITGYTIRINQDRHRKLIWAKFLNTPNIFTK